VDVKRLAIIGTGLIGASVGLAAKRAGVEQVDGYDVSESTLETARERGAIDTAATAADGVAGADLVVVSAPVIALRSVLRGALGRGRPPMRGDRPQR